MSTLDDLLVKRKNIQPILDLSRSLIQNADDFKRLMEKVPEFKTRPIKVRTDEIKLKEKDYSYRMTRKEQRRLQRNHGEHELQYLYQDPVPLEMRAVLLQELFAVPIDWKMLTTVRPKTKMEEEFYTRLIEMGKSQLRLKTAAAAARQRQDSSTVGSGGQHNNSVNINNLYANSNASNLVRKLKNRSGIVETRLLICAECGEELCDGRFCMEFNYETFGRIEAKPVKLKPINNANVKLKTAKDGRKKLPKADFKVKGKKKKKHMNSNNSD